MIPMNDCDDSAKGVTETLQCVGVASDHSGFELKQHLSGLLREAGPRHGRPSSGAQEIRHNINEPRGK
jgi:hypothetical protein